MKIMVSACLLGIRYKYDGGSNQSDELIRRLENHTVVPVCPETEGGLPVPRVPAEIAGGVVVNREGRNVNAEFVLGAEKALEIAIREKPDLIILQSRSPSCGVNEIYDGSFSGKLVPGKGLFAKKACEYGFCVTDVKDYLGSCDNLWKKS